MAEIIIPSSLFLNTSGGTVTGSLIMASGANIDFVQSGVNQIGSSTNTLGYLYVDNIFVDGLPVNISGSNASLVYVSGIATLASGNATLALTEIGILSGTVVTLGSYVSNISGTVSIQTSEIALISGIATSAIQGASNLGNGVNLFNSQLGTDLQFNTVSGAGTVVINSNGGLIIISGNGAVAGNYITSGSSTILNTLDVNVLSGTIVSGNTAFFNTINVVTLNATTENVVTINDYVFSGNSVSGNNITAAIQIYTPILSGTTINSDTLNGKIGIVSGVLNAHVVSGTTISGNSIYQNGLQVTDNITGLGTISVISNVNGLITISGSSSGSANNVVISGSSTILNVLDVTTLSGTTISGNAIFASGVQIIPGNFYPIVGGTLSGSIIITDPNFIQADTINNNGNNLNITATSGNLNLNSNQSVSINSTGTSNIIAVGQININSSSNIGLLAAGSVHNIASGNYVTTSSGVIQLVSSSGINTLGNIISLISGNDNLGSTSSPFLNIYGNNIYENGQQVINSGVGLGNVTVINSNGILTISGSSSAANNLVISGSSTILNILDVTVLSGTTISGNAIFASGVQLIPGNYQPVGNYVVSGSSTILNILDVTVLSGTTINSNNVNIGTTSETALLSVSGNTITTPLANFITYSSSPISGNSSVYIDPSGNVGLNNTSPLSRLSISKFNVNTGASGDLETLFATYVGSFPSFSVQIDNNNWPIVLFSKSATTYLSLNGFGAAYINNFNYNSGGGLLLGATQNNNNTPSQYGLHVIASSSGAAYFAGSTVISGTSSAALLNVIALSGTTPTLFASGNNVGIGTAIPNNILTISGANGNGISILGTNPQINLPDTSNYIRVGATAIFGNSGSTWQLYDTKGSATRFVVGMDTGNVGIGTTTPIALLNVSGNSLASNMPLLNVIALSGTNPILFISGNNVGIGNTSVLAKLHVSGGYIGVDRDSGGFQFIAGGAATRSTITSNTNNDILLNPFTAGGASLGVSNSSYGTTIGRTFSAILPTPPPTDGLVIQGNVGIGTYSPNAALTVSGNSASTPLINTIIYSGATASGSTALYVSQNGMVGIGTNNPTGALDIWNNNTNANSNLPIVFDGGSNGIYFSSGTTGVGPVIGLMRLGVQAIVAQGNGIVLGNNGNAIVGRIIDYNSNKQQLDISDGITLSLTTNNVKRLTVLSGGSIGIGTLVPTQTLEVSGNALIDSTLFANVISGTTVSGNTLALTSQIPTFSVPQSGTLNVMDYMKSNRDLLSSVNRNSDLYSYQPAFFDKPITMMNASTNQTLGSFGIALNQPNGNASTSYMSGYGFNCWVISNSGTFNGAQYGASMFARGSNYADGFFLNSCFAISGSVASYTTSGVRVFIGAIDQTVTTSVNSDNPAGNYAGFQYSSYRPDTNWQFVTKDNTTQNVVNTGLGFSGTSAYRVYIYSSKNNSANIFYRLENLTTGQSTEGSTATHLPTTGQGLRGTMGIFGSGLSSLGIQRLYVEQDV